MKNTFYILLFCFLSLLSKAQPPNLVPNPSFEQLNVLCPFSTSCGGAIHYANNWFQPLCCWLGGSTDIYCACNNSAISSCGVPWNMEGFQYAKTGENYAGADIANPNTNSWLEYLEVGLTDTLKQNKKYCVSWYWSRAGGHQNIFLYNTKTDAMQAVFTADTLRYNSPTYDVILMTPAVKNPSGNILADTVNWNLFSQTYTANGTERFMTIGNFLDYTQNIYIDAPNDEGAYYYFDDFSIYELPELSTTNDTTLCYGSSIQLQASCNGCWAGNKYEWRDAQGNLLSTTASLNISATQTTTYYVNLIDTTNTVPCIANVKDSITITVTGTASAINAGNDTNACVNDTLQIGMPPIPGATYQWQPTTGLENPAASQTNLIVTQAQSYTLTQITQTTGCTITAKDSINITLKPSAEAVILEQDTVLCIGTPLTLNALSYANTNCTWLLNNTIQSNYCSYQTTFYQTQQLVLQLNTNNTNFCIYKNTDTIHVQVIDCDTLAQITIPNVFTPNNDGINDMLDFRFKNLDFVSVEIYDRWGVLVMKNEELKMKNAGVITWNGNTTNGEPCSEGTYFYVLITKSTLGNKEVKEYKGFVTLIR